MSDERIPHSQQLKPNGSEYIPTVSPKRKRNRRKVKDDIQLEHDPIVSQWRNEYFQNWFYDVKKLSPSACCKLCNVNIVGKAKKVNPNKRQPTPNLMSMNLPLFKNHLMHFHNIKIPGKKKLKELARIMQGEENSKLVGTVTNSPNQHEFMQSHVMDHSEPPLEIVKDCRLEEQILDSNFLNLFTKEEILGDFVNKSFCNWIKIAVPDYDLPSTGPLQAELLLKVYEDAKKYVQTILADAASITLVIDVWPDNISMSGCVTFSCSVVTREFQQACFFLSMKQLKHDVEDFGKALKALIEQVIAEWKISVSVIRRVMINDGIKAIATLMETNEFTDKEEVDLTEENGHNFHPSINDCIKLQKIVKDFTDGKMKVMDLKLVGTFLSLPELSAAEADGNSFTTSLRSTCIAHTLHLVVKDGLAAGGTAVEWVLNLASRIVSSIQKDVDDCATMMTSVGFQFPTGSFCLHSQHQMLNLLVEALEKDPLLQTKLKATSKEQLGNKKLRIVKELVLILKTVEEIRTDLETDFQNVGKVIPAYLEILTKVNWVSHLNKTCPFFGKIYYCSYIITVLNKSLIQRMCYVLNDTFFVLGSVLDPHFKLSWIWATGKSKSAILENVLREINKRFDRLRQYISPANVKAGSSNKMYSSVFQPSNMSSTTPTITEEFEIFIKEPTLPLEDHSSESSNRPLEFWKLNAYRFPHLSVVAREIFGIAATSCSRKRMFDLAFDILNACQNDIPFDVFEKFTFIKNNAYLGCEP